MDEACACRRHELSVQEVRHTCQSWPDAHYERMSPRFFSPMDEVVTTGIPDESATRFDADFLRVDGLTWLPWVGHRYSERPTDRRLLVVGESHYVRGSTPEERQANRQKWHAYPQYTRDVVSESLIHRDWTTPTLSNIPKLLFRTSEIDCPRMWGDTAYYNHVQRMMDYDQDGQPERPAWEDFVTGWRVFGDVVRVLQPSHCLFIGVEAARSFSLGSITVTQQVGRTWARTAQLGIGGRSVELIFVQHLGKYFSWSQWHDYLQAQHLGFMTWLGRESYAQTRNV